MVRRTLAAALGALVVVTSLAGKARADDCPERPHNVDKRTQARELFKDGEKAQQRGDSAAAVRAFRCSFQLVPHAVTAFNVGVAAEKSGDVELALEYLDKYLELSPEASDRAAVEKTIADLESRLERALGRTASPEEPPARPVPPAASPPPPAADTVAQAPPPSADDGDGAAPDPGRTRRVLGWTGLGAGALLIGGGTFLNLSARAKVDDCHEAFEEGLPDYGKACDQGASLARASYVSLGLGVAAAAAGAVALWTAPSSPADGGRVVVAPTPGAGVSVGWTGRW